ncbi:MAG: hypothetical protein DMG02_24270 [Acidobacteria bacterium]|nr:MAG: hypothetical protein DMG02_24270 [Acidobacteriota bacterium]
MALAALVSAGQAVTLRAHGTEARRVVSLTWKRDHITRVLDANRSELGLNGSKAPAQMMTIGGQACLFGDLFAFDVDDRYAFDVDEPVDVTVTYAPDRTQPFAIAWDKNGGDGYGISKEISPEPGAALRKATVRLERARFAGLGILNTDLAVGARGGIALCDISIVRSAATKAAAPRGRVQIEVKDADTGELVAARLGLYDATGRTPLPSDQALLIHRYADETRLLWVAPRLLWPSAERQAFYVNGTYETQVPAGSYEVVATKGPEYRVFKGAVDVKAGQLARVACANKRRTPPCGDRSQPRTCTSAISSRWATSSRRITANRRGARPDGICVTGTCLHRDRKIRERRSAATRFITTCRSRFIFRRRISFRITRSSKRRTCRAACPATRTWRRSSTAAAVCRSMLRSVSSTSSKCCRAGASASTIGIRISISGSR